MGTVAGLLLGAGLLCVWWSFWPQEPSTRSASKRASNISDMLVQAGMPGVRPWAFVATSIFIGLGVALVVTALTASPTIGVAFGVLLAIAPTAYVRSRSRKRREELRTLWPDVIDDLISSVRAGMSLPESLIAVGNRGPEVMRTPFTAFADDYRATGRFTESLDLLKERLADPVADRLVEALRLTRQVGGTDLIRLLRTLGGFIRDDIRTRGELEARQSWTVNGARLAAGAPWVVLALLSTRPETAAAFNTALGALILAIGAAASLIAYQAMVRIGRLPEEVRVLR